MVAGAGTFAIGRAAMVYFIEGATLRDARRAFVQSKKKRVALPGKNRKTLEGPKQLETPSTSRRRRSFLR